MKQIRGFLLCLIDAKSARMAIRVSLIVGTLLFSINHGAALVKGQMNRDRWIAGFLTYVIPYMVNSHGQYVSRSQHR